MFEFNTNLKDYFESSSFNVNHKSTSNNMSLYNYDKLDNKIKENKEDYISNKIDFIQGGKYYLSHSINDVKRITNYLKSSEGITWILKQEGLSLMNPKRGYNGIDPINIFNPVKFLMNIPQGGFHITNYGALNANIEYGKFYTTLNNIDYKNNNRLIRMLKEFNLTNDIIQSDNGPFYSVLKLLDNTKLKNIAKNINDIVTNNINNELSQMGGPSSFYGIGSTLIHKSQNDNILTGNNSYNEDNKYSNEEANDKISKLYKDLYINNNIQPSFKINEYNFNVNEMNTYQEISEMQIQSSPYNKKFTNFEKKEVLKKKIDYFKNIPGYKDKYSYSEDESYFQNWNIAKRLGIADNSYIDYNDTNNTHPSGTDKINMGSNDTEDLIKLKIGPIQFRAFISNINDTFAPNWESAKYIGRPDEVYTYTGTKRNITFSLLVPLFSAKEIDSIYSKLNQLVQLQSPIISDTGQMTGQIINLKLGMWFANTANEGLPVVMNQLSFSIDENFTWDIIHEIPMAVNITLGFDVIDNYSPSSTKIYFRGTHK